MVLKHGLIELMHVRMGNTVIRIECDAGKAHVRTRVPSATAVNFKATSGPATTSQPISLRGQGTVDPESVQSGQSSQAPIHSLKTDSLGIMLEKVKEKRYKIMKFRETLSANSLYNHFQSAYRHPPDHHCPKKLVIFSFP